jgi:hypothetical protein
MLSVLRPLSHSNSNQRFERSFVLCPPCSVSYVVDMSSEMVGSFSPQRISGRGAHPGWSGCSSGPGPQPLAAPAHPRGGTEPRPLPSGLTLLQKRPVDRRNADPGDRTSSGARSATKPCSARRLSGATTAGTSDSLKPPSALQEIETRAIRSTASLHSGLQSSAIST